MIDWRVAAALLVGGLLAAAAQTVAQQTPSTRVIRIVLVGDSTVTDDSGWGAGFKHLAGENVDVINTAANGRSSKSFIDEGRWADALAKRGQYYLIQFGHNDEPGKGPERETDPKTTYRANMIRYVEDVRGIGATPILVTSLVRRLYKDDGTIRTTQTPYVEAVRAIAAEKNVPLVDLHAISLADAESAGDDVWADLSPRDDKGQVDRTHLNAKGSEVVGRMVVDALRQAVPELAPASNAVVVVDPTIAAIGFAADDVRAALQAKGTNARTVAPNELSRQTAAVQIVITTTATSLDGQPAVSGLASQGYAIRKVSQGTARPTRWWAIGADVSGAMYAGLEIAEAIKLRGGLDGLTDRQVNPHIARRGIKFNIPLDARTPSYSDDSSSAQANIAEMWSMGFWTTFLDDMARHRYNLLSLWSLSPFPSLVTVPEYPNVALADVKRKQGALWDATLQGRKMYDPGWPLETVKVMSIEQKIAFWRGVMDYARDRGIDVAIFTWNTFVYGTEPSGYGITDSLDNATTRDYVRRSVRTLFNTYPLLTAIGITSGENMGDENAGTAVKERWLWETYGLGVQDAIADARNASGPYYRPGRKIQLIHRAHQSNLADIVAQFRQLPGYDDADSTLSFSFKYSQAHMHSSTKPLFIFQNGWFDTIPPGKKTWLTIRNDDMYYMRWGDPAFVRAYLTSLPDMSKIAGFYMGPDGYTWGREFLGKNSETPRQLVIRKMWFSFLLWGRLAYEPALPDSRFEQIVGARFPKVAVSELYTAWTSVSKILPLVTRFYWGDLDFRWYPEASWSLAGFASVRDLITPKYAPMRADEDGQTPRLQSIKAFVDGEAPAGRLTPLEVADRLDRHAADGLRHVERLKADGDRELAETLGDITAMAWLGRYYAAKIRGAADLYRHEKNGAAADRASAREHLQKAASHWRQYASLWSAQYVGQVLTRMGLTPVDIVAIQRFVDMDVPTALDAR